MTRPAATLLIVDDEPQNRRLLEALLQPEGYRTLTAASGEEALASIAQRAPDLILLDVMMPGMDGYQVAGKLKADPATSNIPIIMVTAQIDRGARLAGLDAGAEEFLTKPVDRAELWLRVRNLLRLKEYGDFLQNHGAILEEQVQSRTADLQRCQAAMDATADSIYLVDRSTMRFVRVNDTACRMQGRTRKELLELGPGDVLSTSREELERAYDALIASGVDAKPVQLPRRRKDGSTAWVEVRLHAHRSGDHWMIVTLERDITERLLAAQELSESDRRFSDLLQNVELVSLMLDREARITYCNEYLLRLTAWRHEEVIGRNWFERFIPPENEAAKSGFAALLANEPEAWHLEQEILTRSGERRLIRWNNSVLRSGAGEVTGTASIGEDITEQKRAEVRIRRLNRVYAVLSGINTLIVRVRDRGELLREACRIAVEQGNFGIAWIGQFDPATLDVTPVAWAGLGAKDFLGSIKSTARLDLPQGQGAVGRAIRELRPVPINDLSTETSVGSARRREALARGYHSVIVLPLIVGGAAVGNLSLFARELNFFDDEEVKLLAELAGDISFALENIERQQKLDKLARIRVVSGEINAAIARVRDRQELLDAACRIAVEQAGFPLAWIGMLDPATRDLKAAAMAGTLPEYGGRLQPSVRADIPGGQGTNGRAFRERKPVVDNDMLANPGIGAARAKGIECGIRSALSLPLLVEGAPAGVMGLYSNDKDYFDEGEIGLLTDVAGNIALALEHMARQEKIGKLSRIRSVSSEINAAIVRIRDRETLLGETCRIASEHGKFEMIWIGAIDHDAQQVRAIAWRGFSEETARSVSWSSITSSQGTLSEAIRTRQPSVRNDIEAELPHGRLRQEALEQGCRSTVCLPFVTDGNVSAIVALFASGTGFFDSEEVALLSEMTGNISFALEHIAKEVKIARLSRIRAVTSSINALIVRARDRQELFDEACRIAVEHGKLGMAWIGVLDAQTQDVTPVAWAGEGAEDVARVKSSARDDGPRGKGAVGRAIRERRPIVNNDLVAHGFGGPRLQAILALGFQSLIALPLFEDQTVTGNLTLYAREQNFFDEEELALLTALAADISFALEHLRRQQKIDKLARIRAVSSEVNASIVRIHDREALLREASRIAVEHGKFEMVWIALIDHENRRIQPVAWAGCSSEVAHQMTWMSLQNTGATLPEVMRTRKVAVRNDFAADLPTGTLRQEALNKGYRSTVCVPFMVDDSVVAAMILYATGRGFFDPEELALLGEVSSDISFALKAIEKQKELDYLSYYDVLTGLANRTLFLERVAQYLRGAAGGGHKLALYLIDLERFKNINDSLGQPAGDELLKQVAAWLAQHVGDATLLARVGADHFAVVLPEVREDGGVARLLEKMMEAFLDHPFRINDTVLRIGAKVGVALYPDDGADANALFRNAEAALKKAKAGGERYLFFTQKMTEAVAGKLTLENQLRQALDNGEFVLHYQPKVALASGRLTGAEALIRWNDPRTGLVPPGQFIPVLEETGLIYEVGRWALRKAIEDYLRWRAAGLAVVPVAVNVSPLQLRNRDFIDEVGQAVGIDPHAAAGLELEITESLIMADVKHSIASLEAIRGLGVRIAIDDFGTGYSSLSYLAKLPVDTLKIDRSFVIDMTAGPEGLALVSTIITLAHSLNLKVVAEGVETEEQSGLLRLLKCDEMQGYLFSKPVPGEIFESRYLTPPDAGTRDGMQAPALAGTATPRVVDRLR